MEQVKKINEELEKEFKEKARPLIKFLNDNFEPHSKIYIETDSAHLLSGKIGFYTGEYIKD